MRLTIVKDDNAVYVDGVAYGVDCSTLPAAFHALQWDSTHGEVEYAATRCDHCGARSKKGNELITDIAPYQKYVDAWSVAKAVAEAEAARVAAEQAALAERAKEQAAAQPVREIERAEVVANAARSEN